MRVLIAAVSFLYIFLLNACQSYKQNILFTVDDPSILRDSLTASDENQTIAVGDYLQIQVFTKNGENIIDPDFELRNTNANIAGLRPTLKYLVRNDGNVKLPMIGDINLLGKTLYEAEDTLQLAYGKFYKNTYINLVFLNKRVIVLGSAGGMVITLDNENTTLVEIIAMAAGIDENGKGHNIRLLRGEQVFVADLTTVSGFQKGNVPVEPGDVIYIEPVRRPFNEFIRDNGSIVSVITSIVSLTILLLSIN